MLIKQWKPVVACIYLVSSHLALAQVTTKALPADYNLTVEVLAINCFHAHFAVLTSTSEQNQNISQDHPMHFWLKTGRQNAEKIGRNFDEYLAQLTEVRERRVREIGPESLAKQDLSVVEECNRLQADFMRKTSN